MNGIARTRPQIMVEETPSSLQAYKPGAIIKMPDGQVKLISKVEHVSGNLTVSVDGGPIDGNINGFPYAIELVD